MDSRAVYSRLEIYISSCKGVAYALISVLTLTCLCPVALASEPSIKPQIYGVFDFPTCVRYAIVHSEEFTKAKIDIQIASTDLKDAHSDILPTLQILTRYYLDRATGSDGNPFSIQLLMTNWDPYLALLKIKSNQILVDMGKLSLSRRMSENIATMGKLFYRIHLLERLIRMRRQSIALQQNKLDYAKSRAGQGSIDSLELRTIANDVRGQQIKLDSLQEEMDDRISQLKTLMGYHPDYALPLDTRDAANQILAGFNGQMVTFTQIQGQNLQLKLAAKQEQLQGNRITGSYVALIPKPLLVFENVQNQVDRSSGFNFALGLDYILWDGFKRVRDIKRQKLKAEQLKIDRRLLSEKLYGNYKRLRSQVDSTGRSNGFYSEQAKLAEMSEEKALMMYKAGDITYDMYIAKRIERVEAEVNSVNNLQNRVDALIDLATISGGLNRYNAGIRF